MLGRRISHRVAVPGRSRAARGLAVVAVLALVVAATLVVALRSAGPGGVASVLAGPRTVTAAPAAPLLPSSALAPLSPGAPVPTAAAVAAALDPLAAAPALATLTGTVTDAATGTVLWAAGADTPQTPASTMKVLTAAAALLTLRLDDAAPTRVLATGTPGQVALVGGGDVTLSDQPVGSPSYYPGAPRVADLVAQVQAAATTVTSVLVDTSHWTGPGLAQGWFGVDVAAGFTAPVQPVMLDGARREPLEPYSPRSATPALDAGRALATGLGLPSSSVTAGTAPDGARQLAEVSSAPLAVRAPFMLTTSDELEAEAIGREVALAQGEAPTFTGTAAAISTALADAGFDVTGLAGFDASGLSVDDRVPVRLLAQVLTAAAGDGPHAAALAPLLTWLPVAGATGTLADRYGATGSGSAGAGFVRAKTGSLTGVSGLAGTVLDTDGRVLVFALLSNGSSPADARPALDAIAATLRGCGCR